MRKDDSVHRGPAFPGHGTPGALGGDRLTLEGSSNLFSCPLNAFVPNSVSPNLGCRLRPGCRTFYFSQEEAMRLRSLEYCSLRLRSRSSPCRSPAGAPPAGKVWKIGILEPFHAAVRVNLIDAFRQGLRQLGYEEGRNFVFEARFADGKLERLPELAAELVKLNVDVIVASSTQAIRAAQQATKTIPIIMTTVGIPSARIRGEPGQARRQYHGPHHPGSGADRQAAAASEGGRPPLVARRAGVGSAHLPRGPGIQGSGNGSSIARFDASVLRGETAGGSRTRLCRDDAGRGERRCSCSRTQSPSTTASAWWNWRSSIGSPEPTGLSISRKPEA